MRNLTVVTERYTHRSREIAVANTPHFTVIFYSFFFSNTNQSESILEAAKRTKIEKEISTASENDCFETDDDEDSSGLDEDY